MGRLLSHLCPHLVHTVHDGMRSLSEVNASKSFPAKGYSNAQHEGACGPSYPVRGCFCLCVRFLWPGKARAPIVFCNSLKGWGKVVHMQGGMGSKWSMCFHFFLTSPFACAQEGRCSSYMEAGSRASRRTLVPVSDCPYFWKFQAATLTKVRERGVGVASITHCSAPPNGQQILLSMPFPRRVGYQTTKGETNSLVLQPFPSYFNVLFSGHQVLQSPHPLLCLRRDSKVLLEVRDGRSLADLSFRVTRLRPGEDLCSH